MKREKKNFLMRLSPDNRMPSVIIEANKLFANNRNLVNKYLPVIPCSVSPLGVSGAGVWSACC